MKNKTLEEIMDLKKNYLSAEEAAAVLGINPNTFRKRANEYSKKFPIEKVGRNYRIPKEPFVIYVRTGKYFN